METINFKGNILIVDPYFIMKPGNTSYQNCPQINDYLRYSRAKEYPDYDEEARFSKMYDKDIEAFYAAESLWKDRSKNDWKKCEFGEKFENINLKPIVIKKIDGKNFSIKVKDLSICTTFPVESGKICIFDYDEVIKYNENYKPNIKCLLINNFDGEIIIDEKEIILKSEDKNMTIC